MLTPMSQDDDAVATTVFTALSGLLGLDARSRANDDLATLGLDSQGLLRLLLEVERALGLPPLDLPDAAFTSPATLVTAIRDAAR